MQNLEHPRRDDNQWADELTHPNPKGFCPTLKVDLSPFLAKLVLIPKILESGRDSLWTEVPFQDKVDVDIELKTSSELLPFLMLLLL